MVIDGQNECLVTDSYSLTILFHPFCLTFHTFDEKESR